ncbi:N4-gp56 family major capsid protein [Neobacillus niacini]|uniref:N4-gp56 family major capsid protein n=1 Tax=Neobacillus niacini TaxID=86668 RepID=UPI002FFE2BEA
MAVNLASKYSEKVDERFKLKSFTQAVVNNDYDWSGVKTVSVYDIPTVAMGNYVRTGSSRYGTPAELDNNKTDYTLTRDRAFTFAIDRGNYQETQMVMQAGKALARQIDEVIVPEIDIYRLAAMSAAATTAGNVSAATVITATNAYTSLLKATEKQADLKVPLEGRVVFVKPSFYNFLKQDNTFIKASEIAQNMLIRGQVGEVDGMKIVMVPSSYLPANTEFIVTQPMATVAPKKLEDYKTHDNPPGINGWLVEGRQIYDAFVLKNKVNAIYVHKNL